MEENNEKNPRRTWDLMIGIALVIFGSLRLYNRLQNDQEWGFRAILTISFVLYGAFLIFRHFKNSSKD
ncbi:hypothetical protein [Aquimarina sp. AU474]|uniref:hypothetical protein n=1 Tax=Aquimarina sp. AU474 TaxID=2108529 RepID=UPI000D68D747|nr:hypothetical protein [Aquimarina sp. AU474]